MARLLASLPVRLQVGIGVRCCRRIKTIAVEPKKELEVEQASAYVKAIDNFLAKATDFACGRGTDTDVSEAIAAARQMNRELRERFGAVEEYRCAWEAFSTFSMLGDAVDSAIRYPGEKAAPSVDIAAAAACTLRALFLRRLNQSTEDLPSLDQRTLVDSVAVQVRAALKNDLSRAEAIADAGNEMADPEGDTDFGGLWQDDPLQLARRRKRKTMDAVGKWTLVERLGKGGNAEVWRATQYAGNDVALKILLSSTPSKEPYKRFRQEIGALKQLDDLPGVLPIHEFSLPEEPDIMNPAWLSMPVATRLRDAVKDMSLDQIQIVEAFQAVASTLIECAARGIFHRDIKPDNLYWYEGRPVIGDFGLAYVPQRETLTLPGRKLGPAFFLPDELLRSPHTAKPGPADVFMFSKTFWVFVTGQRYPPQGEIRAEHPNVRVDEYWIGRNTNKLDELICRCTNATPENRPKMVDVASALAKWLKQ